MSIIDDIWGLLQSVGDTVGEIANGIKISIDGDIQSLSDGVNNLSNGIKVNINSHLSTIDTTLSTMETNIKQKVTDSVDDLTDSLDSILNGLKDAIQNSIEGIQTAFQTVQNNISSYITQGLSDLTGLVQSVADNVATTLSTALQGLGDTVGGIVDAIGKQITTLQSEIGDTLSKVTTSVTGVVGEILQGLGDLNKTILDTLNPMNPIVFAQKQIQGFNTNLAKGLSETANKKSEILQRIVRGDISSFDQLVTLLADPPVEYDMGQSIANFIWSLIGGLLVMPDVAKAYGQLTIQEALKQSLSTKLSPAELAQAFVQNYMTEDKAKDEARYSGVSPDRMQTLMEMAGDPPGGETILEMLNRGFLSPDQSEQAIKESRLKPKYTEAFLKLKDILPPISDLIQFAVKDTFNSDIVNRFGLDDNYPTEVDDYLKQKGLSDFWTHKYWQSHWRVLGAEQVFEMLWRNPETGISLEDVKAFLQQADIAPYWREKLIAIAYKTYTRVDVRRMYKTKDLDANGVKRAYLDIGYPEDKAQKLADFTMHLEDETGSLSPDNQERRLWNQAVDLFIYGFRSENDLKALGDQYGWKDSAIQNEILLAKWRKEEREKRLKPELVGTSPESLQSQIINTLVTLYIQGHRELGDIQNQAIEFNWQPDSIALELILANLKKEAGTKTSKKEELRDLSISAILDAMIIHSITEPDALLKLINLGLTNEDAQIEIEIAKYNESTKQRNEILSAEKSAFKEGLIKETQIYSDLAKYGFPADEIASYVGLWTLENSLKFKNFTEAQLAAFRKNEVITLEQYQAELRTQGWNEEQISWWTKFRGNIQ